MQVAPNRISAADPEVHHAGNREHSFRDESFPEGILLPGLPFHLGKRRRSAPAAGGLGDIQLTGEAGQKFQAANPKFQGSFKFEAPTACLRACFRSLLLGICLELGAWDLGFWRGAFKLESGPEARGHDAFFESRSTAP